MTGKSIILFLAAIYIAVTAPAQAPAPRFVNFGAKDGLAEKLLYCAAQDNLGYMWFGTGSGLYRYDGHQFRPFRSTANSGGRNIDNILLSMAKDAAGNLWLGSQNALQWYQPAANRFWRPNYNHPVVAAICNALINNFTPAGTDTVWIGTNRNFFFRFHRPDSSFTHYTAYPAGATTSVLKVFQAAGTVYAVHQEGIYTFTPQGRPLAVYKQPGVYITQAIYSPGSGSIFCSTLSHGLLQFNLAVAAFNTGLWNYQPSNFHHKLSIIEVPEGGFFLGGYPLHYTHPGKRLYHYYYDEGKKENEGIEASKVVNMFYDREQNLWLCGHSGLSMLPWQNGQAPLVPLFDPVNRQQIEPAAIFGEPRTNNILITNTSGSGLLQYNTVSGQLSVINNPLAKIPTEKRIVGGVQSPDGRLFFGDDKHFYAFDQASRQLKPYPLADQHGRPIVRAGRHVFDKQGRIFINWPNNGFYIWHYPTSRLEHVNKWDADPADTNRNDNNMAPCLVDSRGDCWFISSNGVYRRNGQTGAYTHLLATASGKIPPPGATNFIGEDHRGHIWISTVSNGLYEWYEHKGAEIVVNYKKGPATGLPADHCFKIFRRPGDTCLWISNIGGLLRFDPVAGRVLSFFSKQNGFLDDTGGYGFNITGSGMLVQIYYGHLNLVNLNTYLYSRHTPQVQLNWIKVMNTEFPVQPEIIQSLRLPYYQNYLQFEFAALLYNNANRNQYAWQMEGVDSDWIYGGQTNTASYSALKPGTYTFKVKAANCDGVWGSETIFKIVIRPPFYATWWFMTLCGLALAALAFSWNRGRVNRVRKEEKMKAAFAEQIAATEMKALRAQMNPHFIFNSLNSIQKYILKNENFEASQYLTRFSRLIRLILDHSHQNTVLLSSELDMLRLYVEMEGLRFENKFSYEIKVDERLNTETTELPSMLIQPYVENAIWHGLLHKDEMGRLEISFSMDTAGSLVVYIDDNGIGREKAAELKSKQVLRKKSYGMQITEDRLAIINRLENINATCTIIDKKDPLGRPLGTRVVLTIPIKPLKTN